MTKSRAALLVALVSLAAYANSLGNGFAYDDVAIVQENPNVSSPTAEAILEGAYWPKSPEGRGLYRPTVIAFFALQWWAFDGSPLGFHAVNVALHTTASLLVLMLLSTVAPLLPAIVGALLFAVHPVHVEAVANVVGQSEILAAVAVALACWLYLAGSQWRGAARAARLAAVPALYALGLGAKEIAVTLPALLVLLEWHRFPTRSLLGRLWVEIPVYVSCVGVFATYLVLRVAAVGSLAGEVPALALRELSGMERVLTALTAWPEYVRLFLFPLDLSADYSPAVMLPATGLAPDVVLGALVVVAAGVTAWVCRRRAPLVSLGVMWFCVAILPVSNLLVSAGVTLAERTLYLPSVGVSFAAAGVIGAWPLTSEVRARRIAIGMALVALLLLMTRTVLRNPAWYDSYTVMNTLALDHPESFVALRARAGGLARVGDHEGAVEAYEAALFLAPRHEALAVEVAKYLGDRGSYARAEEILLRTIRESSELAAPYVVLSELLLVQGRGRDAHAMALRGVAAAGADVDLFALISESYVAKGDLGAAARARRAAAGQAEEPHRHWQRLAELYDAMGRAEEAREARTRAGPPTS